MPPAKLKATAVTAKAPPTAMIQPLRSSSRRRRLSRTMPMPPASASPSSQPAWPPSASFSSRSGPVEPPNGPPPPKAPGPPPCPSRRPRPLYSRISEKTLLSLVPATQGRLAAGVSSTSSGQASPTTVIAAPPPSSARSAAARPRGATQSQASAIPGTTISATPIFASKPSPTQTPARRSQPLRPCSSARTNAHSAATQQRTRSASGLLWREIATVIGVSASTRPATKPAWRPQRRRVRS